MTDTIPITITKEAPGGPEITEEDIAKLPGPLEHLQRTPLMKKQNAIASMLRKSNKDSNKENAGRTANISQAPTPLKKETKKPQPPPKPVGVLYSQQRAKEDLTQEERDRIDNYVTALFAGCHFRKHGRRGSPKDKFVVCNQEGTMYWTDGDKALTCIRLVNVEAVTKGKQTAVLKRKTANSAPPECCFSLRLPRRTVDFEAEDEESCDLWLAALKWAVENVQSTGKITKEPVASTAAERKEREYDAIVKKLQAELSETKTTIQHKNEQISKREQELAEVNNQKQQSLKEKDLEVQRRQAELERLQKQQAEINQRLKRVHHERHASRAVRQNLLSRLEAAKRKVELERQRERRQHQEEKKKLVKIVADSEQLLTKAKATIHRRQVSRQDRLAAYGALELEVEELRRRNNELRKQVAAAKQSQEKAMQEVERVRNMLKAAAIDDSCLEGATAPQPKAPEEDDVRVRSESLVSSNGSFSYSSAPSFVVEGVEINRQDIAPKSVWQPDSASRDCIQCCQPFNFFNRRHHCRKCGVLVCGDCSRSRYTVSETTEKVRVCNACTAQLRPEIAEANRQ